jgi:hypothetical protein
MEVFKENKCAKLGFDVFFLDLDPQPHVKGAFKKQA